MDKLEESKLLFEALDMAAKRHDAQASAVQKGGHAYQHHAERAEAMRELRNRIAREAVEMVRPK
jgi:hypothetical protein